MNDKKQKILLSLGGNIGNTIEIFEKSFQLLDSLGIKILDKSSIIKTAPVDCPAGTADFYNMVILGETALLPLELLKICQDIEVALGRPREHGYHLSRTLDIDIIAIGNEVIDLEELTVPHKEAKNRDFVMLPIRELQEKHAFSEEDFIILCEKI